MKLELTKATKLSFRFIHSIMVVFLVAIMIVRCQKDDDPGIVPPTIPEETPCEYTPPNSNGQLPPGIVDSMYFSRGLVNPKNPNEILFLNKKDSKVYKLNYITGEKIIVLEEGMGFGSADWSIKDWVLFTRFQNLYKVKSNGDSLTQITFNGTGWNSNWNPSGTHYTYVTSSSGTGYIRVIADLNDEIIDTLSSALISSIDWYSDSLIFWGRGNYNLIHDSLIFHLPSGPWGDVAGISSTKSLHLMDGLILLDNETGTWSQIQSFPTCYNYYAIEYSPQKGKLLTSRLYQKVMPDGRTVYNKGEIVWLNLDGTVHEVIDIAQFMNE